MIEYIHGDLTELTPTQAVIETAGVGYALSISLNTYTAIQGKREAKLYVHEVLVTGGRDDSFTLYGFALKQERELYRLLITVSGVGAGTARMILSSMSPRELCNVISTANEAMLKGVKGIGLKNSPAHHHRLEGQDRKHGNSRRAACQRRKRGHGEQRREGRGGERTHHARILASAIVQGGGRHPEGTARPEGGTGDQDGSETNKMTKKKKRV